MTLHVCVRAQVKEFGFSPNALSADDVLAHCVPALENKHSIVRHPAQPQLQSQPQRDPEAES